MKIVVESETLPMLSRCAHSSSDAEVSSSTSRGVVTRLTMTGIALIFCHCLMIHGPIAEAQEEGFGDRRRGEIDSGENFDREGFGGRRRGFRRGRGEEGGDFDRSRGGFGGDFGGPPGGFGGPFGGPPGGFGGGGFGGGGDRGRRGGFTSMIDRNGDGEISEDEIEQMPSFMQDMIRSRGIEVRAGMSVDEFRDSIRGGFSGRRSGDERSSDRSGRASDTKPAPKPVLKPYVQKPRDRVTIDLPPKYSEYDTDLDGQVAFHEWLEENREQLDDFEMIDQDSDGFLTPLELHDHDTPAVTSEDASTTDGSGAGRRGAAAKPSERLKIVAPGGDPRKAKDSGRRDDRNDENSREERLREFRRRSERAGSE